MITLTKKGRYALGETKNHIKLLYLNGDCYVWLFIPSIGDVLAFSVSDHTINAEFSSGEYLLYDVNDEDDLIDLQHLELRTSGKHWQSYLLLTGLPSAQKKRSRIIPTSETITTALQKKPILSKELHSHAKAKGGRP